jgi:hypothetical protein
MMRRLHDAERPMPRFLLLSGLLLLAACADDAPGSQSNVPGIAYIPQFITGLPGEQPNFGVTALAQAPTQPGYVDFNNAAPGIAEQHAASVCTLGWEKLEEGQAPGDPVGFTRQRIRCNAYRPSLF